MKLTKKFLPILTSIAALSVLGFTPAANAVDVCSQGGVSAEVKKAAGCSGSTDIASVIQTILNSVIAICGIIAVIFIVIGGIKYMTSSGDSGKVKQARDTILYAVIGLIVCALAFAIVNFVIGGILKQ